MLASSRPKACTSRTPEMLSCRSALTLPISMRVRRKALRAWPENHAVTTSITGTTAMLIKRIGRSCWVSMLYAIQTNSSESAGDAHQGKADRLLDGVHVVGDAAHHVAGFVFSIVTERKPVQVLEDLHPQVLSTCCPAQVIK